MDEIVYKVVDARYPDSLRSSGMEGKYELEYRKGKVTIHPNIMVFVDQRMAELWCTEGIEQVWECTTSKVKPKPEFYLWPAVVDNYYEIFWTKWVSGDISEKEKELYTLATPEGMALVDDLKLVRRIK